MRSRDMIGTAAALAASVILASCGAPSAQTTVGSGVPAAYEHSRFSGQVLSLSSRELSLSGATSVSRCSLLPSTRFSVVAEGVSGYRPGDVVMADYGTGPNGAAAAPETITNYGPGDLSAYRVAPRNAARLFAGKVKGFSADGKLTLADAAGATRSFAAADVPGSVSVSSIRPVSAPAGSSADMDCRRISGGNWEADAVTLRAPRAPVPASAPAVSPTAEDCRAIPGPDGKTPVIVCLPPRRRAGGGAGEGGTVISPARRPTANPRTICAP